MNRWRVGAVQVGTSTFRFVWFPSPHKLSFFFDLLVGDTVLHREPWRETGVEGSDGPTPQYLTGAARPTEGTLGVDTGVTTPGVLRVMGEIRPPVTPVVVLFGPRHRGRWKSRGPGEARSTPVLSIPSVLRLGTTPCLRGSFLFVGRVPRRGFPPRVVVGNFRVWVNLRTPSTRPTGIGVSGRSHESRSPGAGHGTGRSGSGTSLRPSTPWCPRLPCRPTGV